MTKDEGADWMKLEKKAVDLNAYISDLNCSIKNMDHKRQLCLHLGIRIMESL